MSNHKPSIVLWGGDNYNTLGMVRSLNDPDFDVLLLVKGKFQGVASASKYCRKKHSCKTIDECINYLIKNYPETDDPNLKAILMPGGDTYSLALANNYDLLSKRFHLMCTEDPKTLIKVTDKSEMCRIAERAGLLVPKSQKISKHRLKHNVPYPIILKHIHTEGRIEFKTKIIKSEKQLIEFSKFLNPNNTYLAQQYIPRTHDIYVHGCRLQNGTLYLAGHNNQYRWSDDGGGSFGDLNPNIPDYIDVKALESFLALVDYHGLLSAEFGYYDGKAYFQEVNFRNDGFTHLALQAGANLPLLWVSDCLNLGIATSHRMKKRMISFNEVYDISNVLNGNISYRQYKKDKQSAEAFIYYDSNDPQPYYNLLRRRWLEIPLRAVFKTARPYIVWILNKFNL